MAKITMAAEDELPVDLRNLEITPILPLVKLLDSNLPIQLNPFYENDLQNTIPERNVDKNTGVIKKSQSLNNNRIGNQKCRRCRYRRPLESALDELKQSSNSPSVSDNTRTSHSRVVKQALKKSVSSVGGYGTRKVILREPILKALQTCLHHHTNVQEKFDAAANSKPSPINDGPLATKGMSDFRDLIDECRNLLFEDVDFNGRLGQLSLNNRNSKNFTTIQTPKKQINHKSHKHRRAMLNTATLPLPSLENTSLNEDHHNAYASISLMQPAMLGSSISSTNSQQRNIISNLSPEQVSNHTRCNTTCSQQAGNSVAASCDDVTIDELASYFDTFVHIPKKMSSMAEMMYI